MVNLADPVSSFVELLQIRSATTPDKIVYRYLTNGENDEITLSYQQLDRSARIIAAALLCKGTPSDRALLLYPDGLEFIKAFFGCLYAGIIAVPAFPPRRNQKMHRLLAIIDDCKPSLVLTEQKTQDIVSSLFKQQPNDEPFTLLVTDDPQCLPLNVDIEFPPIQAQALAFLQYTSGSTADPKGVMVSHANLVANAHTLHQIMPNGPDKIGVSWLPMFHDMGLIAGVFQPLFADFPIVLMPPTAFLQKPLRWLQAISRFKACVSVAPNMAYDLCVQSIPEAEIPNLDLSHWQAAFNGAEPVRAASLQAFSEKFGPCGFSEAAFSPCYGMAETTLIMTGKPVGKTPITCKHESTEVVSCGQVDDEHQLLIVNPKTCEPCRDDMVGEIWVRGLSITQGYWQRPESTRETFTAYTKGEGPFLRTGDLGFMHQGELFVTGRLKDLIIIRGRNHYPQDIEACVANSHAALVPNAGAAFSVDQNGAEKLVVVQEIKRSFARKINHEDIFSAIRQRISEFHELEVNAIVLVKQSQIPRTSSGKIQRNKCRQQFLAQTLKPISQWSLPVKAFDDEVCKSGADLVKSDNGRKSVQEIQYWLQEKCAESLQIPVASVDISAPLTQFGIDSMMAIQISFELEEWLDISLSPTLIYDFPSIALIANYLGNSEEESANNPPVDDSESTTDQPTENSHEFSEAIAIIGMSCRLPKASGIEDFWHLLCEGMDATDTVPVDRWDVDSIYHPDPDMPGSCYHKRGGFVANIEQFDADFFGIAGREANSLDPQQRLLLEMSWEALEHANILPASLELSKTGVFIGHSGSEYPYVNGYTTETNGYLLTGQMASTCAGRISYSLGLKGPCYAVDTACSSSLASLHLACQSLNQHESDLAIAGGITLLLTPRIFIEFSRLRASATDGRCKSFSNTADGAGWSDGAGLLILKRLQDAEREGDTILAIIRGSAVNQDGRSAGLTTPNGPSQQQVIQQALIKAKLQPEDIDYVEAHGTGTSLGDPIEANALTEVFKSRNTPLYLGSVKSNLGHTMAAAGVTSVIKTVLALQHELLPKTLHADIPSTYVNWAESPLELLQSARPWPRGERKRRAGISSFGLSGTNAHVILEEVFTNPESPVMAMSSDHATPTRWPLVLSAKTATALRAKIEQLCHFVADKAPNPWDLAYTLATRRSQFPYRAALVIEDNLLQIDRTVLAKKLIQGITTVPKDWNFQGTVFLYTGQGSQWAGMGQALYEEQPFFRQTLDQVLSILNSYLTDSVDPPTRLLWDADLLAITRYAQPALFALQVALTRLWQSWGVQPDVLLGHSVGEIAAAYIAGVFSLETACQLVVARGEMIEPIPDAFKHILETFEYHLPNRPLISSMSGQLASEDIASASYWIKQAVSAVDFVAAMESVKQYTANLVIEIGPHPMLSALGAGFMQGQYVWLPSLSKQQKDDQVINEALCQAFMHGVSVNWSGYFKSWPSRCLNFPCYPFQHQRYWLDKADTHATNTALAPTRHPLLGSHNAIAGTSIDLFISTISLNQLGWLRDHQVFEHTLMPAAALLELSYAALKYLGFDATQGYAIRNFSVIRPLKLSTEPVRVQISVHKKGDEISLSIQSQVLNLENALWHEICSAQLGSISIPDMQKVSLPQEMAGVMTAKLYDDFASYGLNYGPAFRGLKQIWHKEDAVWGHVELGEVLSDQRYHIHPALLDASLHSCLVLAQTMQANHLYLPVAAQEFCLYQEAGSSVWVKASLCGSAQSPQSETLEFNVELYDDQGSCLGYLRKFVAKRVDATVLLNSLRTHVSTTDPNVSDTLMQVDWQEFTTSIQSASSSNCRYHILMAEQEQQALTELLPTLTENDCVVLQWSSTASLAFATALNQQGLLQLQILIQSQTPATIVWVTQGTHIIAGEPQSAMAARGLWGLARTARSEYSQLKLKLLDITPQCQLHESVLSALIAHQNEFEFALRNDKLYVPRLIHVQTPADPPFSRNDGTILITGGLGALGRHVARWLVREHRGKHLVLASRSGMDHPQAQDVINELQELGASVEVVQCDVSDKAQVTQLFADFPEDLPLRAIYHTAGSLADNLLPAQTAEQLAQVFAAKVLGAWHLHELSQHLNLDSFVLYSSFASVIGNPGQANYVAANQCLESLAAYRHQQQLPATAIAWGYWSDADSTMVRQLQTSDIARFERLGLAAINAKRGAKLLTQCLAQHLPSVVAVPLDKQKMGRFWGDSPPALFTVLLQPVSHQTFEQTSNSQLLQQLMQMDPQQREAVLFKNVRELIATVLDHSLDKIVADAQLKDLGMDSLMAIEIRNRLMTLTGINLDADTLFTLTSASKIAQFLNDRLTFDQDLTLQAIERQPTQAHYPLSSNQARLWFLQQRDPSSIAYSEPVILEMLGEVKITAIEKTLERLLQHHAVFRTQYREVEGVARQFVLPESPSRFEVIDLVQMNAEERIQQQEKIYERIFQTPFDLSEDVPLRVAAICFASDQMQLLLNFHHIITDATSIKLFFTEFVTGYNAFAQTKMPHFTAPSIQYTDYTLWQQNNLIQANAKAHLAYWKDKLANASYLTLPYNELLGEQAIKKSVSHHGSKFRFKFSENTISQLNTFCRDHDVTLHMVLLGTLTLLLSRYSDQKDICIGGPTLGRNRQELASLQGFFANTVVYRNQVIDEQSFSDFIQAVKSTCIEAFQHQDCPFDEVVKSLDLTRTTQNPLFQVMFNVLETPQSWNLSLLGVYTKIKDYHNKSSKFNLSLCLLHSTAELWGEFEFKTELFSQTTIERMADHFELLLKQLLSKPDLPVDQHTLMTPREAEQLLMEWNDTAVDFNEHQTLHDRFETEVTRMPNHIALVFGEQHLTYAELNERSNQLAHYLKEQGVVPDQLVGVCVVRSIDMVIGIMGILKAGGAYLPLDPEYPPERLHFMLADANVKIILSQQTIADKQPSLKNWELVLLDHASHIEKLSAYPQFSVSTLTTSRHLAYVIYTSGTTGKPKGVMIEHRSVNRLVLNTNYVDLDSSSVILQAASPSFDAMTFELWGAFLNGGTLVLYPEVIPTPSGLQREITTHKVTHLWLTAGLFNTIVNEDISVLKGLKQLMVGGETLSVHHINLANAALAEVELINGYGPTESTTFAAYYKIDKERVYKNNIPIGRPISNTQLYVLSSTRQLVPVGTPGDLYIGGAGLARGYLNQPELTAEKFISNPYNENTRLYCTGDRVRYLADGNLEFIGRTDDQVKVRGFRIELGEIENILKQHRDIAETVVLARNKASSNHKELIAYIVAKEFVPSDIELRMFLEDRIPLYMIPEHYVVLDKLPLTTNGKLDKRALIEFGVIREANYVAPRNELELKVSEIWAEVLGLSSDKVGIQDDFFRLGGDSIVSIQLVSRLRLRLEINVSVEDIFEFKTIERLYDNVLAKKQADKLKIKTEQGVLSGEVGLLPIQEWFFDSHFTDFDECNSSFLLKVPQLAIDKLIPSIEKLVLHHDALRLRYKKVTSSKDDLVEDRIKSDRGNQFIQYYADNVEVEQLKLLDLSTLKTKEGSVKFNQELETILTDWQREFNLENGPTYSIGYIHGYKNESARIYFALHHLIADRVSWQILVEDLKDLYEDRILRPKRSSYRQWVETLFDYRSKHSQELAYWNAIIDDYASSKNNLTQLTLGDRSLINLSLTPRQTKQLLQLSHQAYHTQINDLLLTALALSLAELTENEKNYIVLESHGREKIASDIDITRTVGCFISMYPIRLEIKNDIGSCIKSIKENLRNVPNNGIGYGALIGYHSYELPKISFNYLGNLDKSQEDFSEQALEKLWNIIIESKNATIYSSNPTILNISGLIVNRKLSFNISSQLSKTMTKAFATSFANNLSHVISHTINILKEQRSYLTISDVGKIINQEHLDRLQQFTNIENVYLANSLQQGFIYHALNQGHIDNAYKIQLIWQYHNKLDINRLKQAWESAQAKYEVLRLRFDWEESLIQVIDKEGKLSWHYLDLSDEKSISLQELKIKQIQQQDRQEIYNLSTAKLFKVYLIKQQSDLYTCIFSSHHAILDGWSNTVLLNYIHDTYLKRIDQQNIELRVDTIYGETQKYLQQHSKDNEAYWREYLAQIKDRLDLSGLLKEDMRLTRLNNYKYILEPQEQNLIIDNELYTKIKIMSQDNGFTLNALLQYIWHKLLSIYGTTHQTIVGVTVSGRNLPINHIENGVGLFINTLPLIVEHNQNNHSKIDKLESNITVKTKILEIQEAINILNEKTDVNLAKLHKGERLFDSLFVYENYPAPNQTDVDNLFKMEFKHVIGKLDYPLVVIAYESRNQLVFKLNYAGELFAVETIAALLQQAKNILQQIALDINLPIDKINLLTPQQYQQIVYGWNKTDQDYPHNKTIHELFEEQVIRRPNNIAMIYKDKKLTYGELNRKANQLAHYLRDHYQLKPDDLIALCLVRSEHMLIAILAVLKAGGAYVPIDPAYPDERIEYILTDTQTKIILIDEIYRTNIISLYANRDLQEEMKHRIVAIDSIELQSKLSAESSVNLNASLTSRHLAYVIYTSGTTGKPKGVMIEHRSVNRLVLNTNYVNLDSNSVILQAASPSFDAMTFELWGALLNGGTLVLYPEVIPTPTGLQHEITTHRVTHLWLTAGLFNTMVNEDISVLKGLKQLMVGGEALSVHHINLANAALAEVELINGYGPTESTTFAAYYKIDKGRVYKNNIPIGRPISNTQLYVLSSTRQLVPVGTPGDLYIGGAGLARGYLNQPELTAEKFISNPYNENTRLYCTGDRVRYLPDGNLEFIGRTDDQVKVRGFRIELGEIEGVLKTSPLLNDAVVITTPGPNNATTQLVAYVVPIQLITGDHEEVNKAQQTLNTTLRGLLQRRLPSYMMPQRFIVLDALPLTASGKLDRKALLAPSEENIQRPKYIAPNNSVEQQLCAIWQEVLKREHIGIQDNFFELGGDSILSIQVVARAKRSGLIMTIRQLFEYPTIADLVPHLSYGTAVNAPQEPVTGRQDLLPIQQHFFDLALPEQHHFNQSILLQTPVGFTWDHLQVVLKVLYHRHDVLRLQFKQEGNTWLAEYQPYDDQMITHALFYEDLSSLQDDEKIINLRASCAALQESLNLEKGQLLRAAYFCYGTGVRGRLFLVLHHLIVDGVSWRILCSDLMSAYGKLTKGEAVVLSPKVSSFQQWGVALRGYARSTALLAEKSYWLQQLSLPFGPVPGQVQGLDSLQDEIHEFSCTLTQEETQQLLGECNKAYRTRVNELLIAALLKGYQDWSGQPILRLIIEGHGREELFETLDVTETVGWFTSIYPLVLSSTLDLDLAGQIKLVKEQCRHLPCNGMGYGILTKIVKDPELSSLELAQESQSIVFNYLGTFDNLQNDDLLFCSTRENTGANRSSRQSQTELISINGLVANGQLCFRFTGSSKRICPKAMADFCEAFEKALKSCIAWCTGKNPRKNLRSKVILRADAESIDEGIEI